LSDTDNEDYGWDQLSGTKILAKYNCKLDSINVFAGQTTTTAYLYNADQTVLLKTAPIV
jgi:hypothetical protein